eukprot:131134_1
MNYVYLVAFPFYGMGTILIFFCGAIFVSEWYMPHNDNRWNSVMLTAVLYYLCIVTCSFLDTVHLFLCWITNKLVTSANYAIIKSTCDFLYFLSSSLFNIILFMRLYMVFKNSTHALSKKLIVFISFQIICSIGLNITNSMLMIAYNDELSDTIALTFYVSVIVLDLTVSLSMIVLFTAKLQKLIVQMKLNIIHAIRQDNECKTNIVPKAINVNEASSHCVSVMEQTLSKYKSNSSFVYSLPSATIPIQNNENRFKRLVIVMTRNSLLGIIAICFNQLFYIISLIYFIVPGKDMLWKSHLFGAFHYGLRILGMTGIGVCILLQMRFAQKSYYRICWICHIICFKCCVKCTNLW